MKTSRKHSGGFDGLPRLHESLYDGYRLGARVDEGDRAHTYLGVHEATGEYAAVKVFNPAYEHPGFVAEAQVMFQHPGIPRVLGVGQAGARYIIHDWVVGVPFAALLEEPPSSDNTRRLCRAILRLAEVVSFLHSTETAGRKTATAHRQITSTNVIVKPNGDIGLINFDRCWPAPTPRMEQLETGGNRWILAITEDCVTDLREDVDAVRQLFRSIWQTLDAAVIPIGAGIPRAIADLRLEEYETIDSFRIDLEIALTIAGMSPA